MERYKIQRRNIPVGDHFDGRRFFMPESPYPNSLRNVLKWQMHREPSNWPKRVDCGPTDHPPSRIEGAALRACLVGHATVLIQTQGLNLLIDPIWSERASPVSWAGPRRVSLPGIDWGDLPPIDAVLITHNHYDHLDLPTLKRLEQRFHSSFVTPLGNGALIASAGSDMRITELDWGESYSLRAVSVHLEPAQHWSSRNGFDRNKALWGAFVLSTAAGNVYIAGDTGFGDGRYFRRAAKTYGSFRLAVLPIGAYAPRWFMGYSHLHPEEAVEAFQWLKAEQAIGYHWGVFQLTDEAREAPRDELAKALARAGIAPERFIAFESGQVWERSSYP